jgi:hypothetical protein
MVQLSEFAAFRQQLRALLAQVDVPSNPGWTENDIVNAFRELLEELVALRETAKGDNEVCS